MSENIQHECGIVLIRLRKPLSFYQEKYGTALYGLSKLQLMMQKQRNRGQDGAGIAVIKHDMPPGYRYISRKRAIGANYLQKLFKTVYKSFDGLSDEQMQDAEWLKLNKPYTGELLLGHLRYGTHGLNNIESCHPFLRKNNWMNRSLVLAGNFNLTNVDTLFQELLDLGQFPKERSEAVTMLEKMGHFLDDEVQRLFNWFKSDGYSNQEINELIVKNIDIQRIVTRTCKRFDGGYVMTGMIGHGDAFVIRDPNGIRPAFYYENDEIVVVASERPAIQTAFDILHHDIKEVQPGHVLTIRKDGRLEEHAFQGRGDKQSCSFERIYFSRGNDRDIYRERKALGAALAPRVLEEADYDFDHTVFSFIPNTAETAHIGLIEECQRILDKRRKATILAAEPAQNGKLDAVWDQKVRVEKLVVKDAKMRTFIADELVRNTLVSHVYDVTYGIIENEKDTIVLIDDSIVRGTTLRDSIVEMVARLRPRKIIVLSSAPQIRYPDCYGIDMSIMSRFVAFQAMISLLQERNQEDLLEQVYQDCKRDQDKAVKVNHVQRLYAEFTDEEISDRISAMLSPDSLECELKIIYQKVDALNEACPDHLGDWYFSGNYPTPGGNKVVHRAFINFMEKREVRAY